MLTLCGDILMNDVHISVQARQPEVAREKAVALFNKYGFAMDGE